MMQVEDSSALSPTASHRRATRACVGGDAADGVAGVGGLGLVAPVGVQMMMDRESMKPPAAR
jgi:hypothetical protein